MKNTTISHMKTKTHCCCCCFLQRILHFVFLTSESTGITTLERSETVGYSFCIQSFARKVFHDSFYKYCKQRGCIVLNVPSMSFPYNCGYVLI